MSRSAPKKRREPRVAPVGSARRRWTFLALCATGLLLSADLARLHVRVHTDPQYESYCSLGEGLDCEAVAASPWSVFGGVPLALWGLGGYLLLGALALAGTGRRAPVPGWPFGLLFALALACAALGLYLAWVSHFVIRSLCLVCGGTYLVNLALAVVAWLELRGGPDGPFAALRRDLRVLASRPRLWLGFAVLPVVVLVLVRLALPAYWKVDLAGGLDGLAVGRTEDGHPWIGAADPGVEIVEFSDYQCPACQRGHRRMRKLLEVHRGELRLVHRHFPLDQACNPIQRQIHLHACRYSYLAICAGEQDRFWEANDFVLERGRREEPVTADELAGALGLDAGRMRACMESERPRHRVAADVSAGRVLGVHRTPTFLLDGRAYSGAEIEQALRERLQGPARR